MELSKVKKVVQRGKFTVEDTITFCQDVMKGDTTAVMHKTSGNIKRQWQRLRALVYFIEQNTVKTKNAIVEGVHHTVHGLKHFGKDSKWLIA